MVRGASKKYCFRQILFILITISALIGCGDGDGLTRNEPSQPAVNPSPKVDAGSNQTITSDWVNLDGTVKSNGTANRLGSVTTIWSKVTGVGNVIFGNAEAVDTTATFSDSGTYVLRLTAVDGTLQASHDVMITVSSVLPSAPKVWGTPVLIETDDAGDAYSPKVAVDDSGNATAVWWQSDGTRVNAYANHYQYGTDVWDGAGLIEIDNAGGAASPQVAIDGNGNAIAVWYQYDGTSNNIYANHYRHGKGWGQATLIETSNAGHAYGLQVAVDGNSHGLIVWTQSDGTRNNLYANYYDADTGWGQTTIVETGGAGSAASPKLSVDGSGNAIVVWYQFDGTRFNIYANHYRYGIGWGQAVLIETDDAGDAASPQLAVDGGGNAIAVWYQSDGTRNNIWANRYLSDTGWGQATLLETDPGQAYWPQVAVDSGGHAIATWQQHDGKRWSIYANRYLFGTGWGQATLIETNNAGRAHSPQLAMDGIGHAVVLWQQFDGKRFSIYANRYTPEIGWGIAGLIETNHAGDASLSQLAMDRNGNAIAVWEQFDGTRVSIWANSFR